MSAGPAAFALALLLTAGGAVAEDAAAPLWANLAECSAVFAAAAQADGYSGADPDLIAQAATVSDRFHAKSVQAAAEAGQSDPEADVASIMVYLLPRWENRIERLFSVTSNLAWIDYCRRLGLDQGVLPLAE